MKSPLLLVLAIFSSLLLSNCATMFNSGTQNIVIRGANNEKDVEVEITSSSGSYQSELPTTVSADSSYSGVKIKVLDKCYDPIIHEVNKSVTPSYFANIFNFYGLFIDLATAKLWKYDNSAVIPLRKKENCEKFGIKEPLSKQSADELLARNIHWKIDSTPAGAVVNYRVVSTTNEISSTPNTYLDRAPYEGVKRINIPGLTHENMKDVIISIEVSLPGYYPQKKEIALTSVLQTYEISLHFALTKTQ